MSLQRQYGDLKNEERTCEDDERRWSKRRSWIKGVRKSGAGWSEEADDERKTVKSWRIVEEIPRNSSLFGRLFKQKEVVSMTDSPSQTTRPERRNSLNSTRHNKKGRWSPSISTRDFTPTSEEPSTSNLTLAEHSPRVSVTDTKTCRPQSEKQTGWSIWGVWNQLRR
ncbi:hypothetical protein BC829DRAFT_488263 [Chytridium lagenaria]|nr:hypothetical protein BC829DRAFT_488263 [Chytridium lagenaria]